MSTAETTCFWTLWCYKISHYRTPLNHSKTVKVISFIYWHLPSTINQKSRTWPWPFITPCQDGHWFSINVFHFMRRFSFIHAITGSALSERPSCALISVWREGRGLCPPPPSPRWDIQPRSRLRCYICRGTDQTRHRSVVSAQWCRVHTVHTHGVFSHHQSVYVQLSIKLNYTVQEFHTSFIRVSYVWLISKSIVGGRSWSVLFIT